MQTTFATIKKHCPAVDLGMNGDKPVFYAHEYLGDLDELTASAASGVRFHGWYADSHQHNIIMGMVFCLPARPGFPDGVYLAGYVVEDNDERVIYPECFDNTRDCAHMADEHARVAAAQAKEDADMFDQCVELEGKVEQWHARLRECIALRHRTCMTYVRAEARELIEKIRTGNERLRTEFANWS
jgi:hypothetical protein